MYHPSRYDSRTFLLYIDACEQGNPSGRFANPCTGESGTFQGMAQLIMKIDSCLDIHNSPQAFHTVRQFVPHANAPDDWPAEVSTRPGQLANFTLQILFRRNASWQGTITWLESDQTQRFRSALELMNLIGNAMDSFGRSDKLLRFCGYMSPLTDTIEG